jgi:hypothetical protein
MSTVENHDGYVECDSCGHPIEDHNKSGCDECDTCKVSWTRAEVSRVRRESGLPGRF